MQRYNASVKNDPNVHFHVHLFIINKSNYYKYLTAV